MTQWRRAAAVFFLLVGGLPGIASADGLLALKRVMLSSAGVGYFEYEADIDGPATVGLDVPLAQVDDVLNSLVVYDSAGGVGGLELPGRDQDHAAFAALPFGPEALGAPLAYLNGLRGAEVQVTGPQPMAGKLVGAETVPAAGNTPARTRVTVLGADGLRQFLLDDATSVQLTDPMLRAAVDRALAALHPESGSEMRHVSLHSTGTGHRTVRVGYVVAAPLWKATYRLVLPAADAGSARLQGWAVLENETGQDWNGVELTLQYGNPVTFRQAIYRSYYADRPEVPVDILARLLPDVDTRSRPAALAEPAMPMPAPPVPRMMQAAPAPRALAAPEQAAVAAEGVTDTVFRIPQAFDLPAGHTASVPFLDRAIPAERLVLAQPPRPHPLSVLRLRNDAGTSLPGGALALYDLSGAASFAGDARLGGLPAGETRLLPFAEDLRSTVEQTTEHRTDLAGLTVAGGVAQVTERDRDILHITLTAPAREPRHMLLEIPRDDDRRLSLDGGDVPVTEQTATAWRLRLDLAAGEVRHITALLDQTTGRSLALLDPASADAVTALVDEAGLPAAGRDALRRVVDLRRAEADRTVERDALRAQLDAVDQDEDRLRRNLAAVPPGDALHGRLVRQLDADETRIGDLRARIADAEARMQAAHRALAEAVAGLRL